MKTRTNSQAQKNIMNIYIERMGAQNKPIQEESSSFQARIIMIKSSSNKLYIDDPDAKVTAKKSKQNETWFKTKFKNFDFQYLQASDSQHIYVTKQKVLKWLMGFFSTTSNLLFLFYSGHGYENGDWKIQSLQNPDGDRISLQQIITLWRENKQSSKSFLSIFMDSCYSGNWCKKLQENNQRSMNVFASCNQNQISRDFNGSLFFNCFLCDRSQLSQNFSLLTKYQTPMFISNSDKRAKLKQQNIQLLQQNIYNSRKIQSCNQKIVKIYQNGQRYEGQLVHGVKAGKGALFSVFGQLIYIGEWENNMMNGKGTMFYDDGSKYTGLFKNNQKHGNGVKFYPNGVKYFEGQYANDKANGKGIIYYPNSYKKYEGDFVNNKSHGKGFKFYDNGNTRYEGDFIDNNFDGKGIEYYENGILKYQGDFVRGQYNGRGTFYFEDDQLYQGEFYNGQFHGEGIEYYSNRDKKYEGQFRNNKRNGEGVYYFEDGDRYQGQFHDDKRNGYGVCYYSDGTIMYEGQCVNGEAHGRGVRYYSNGQKYDGQWRNNKKNGRGVQYDCVGNIKQQGIWLDDHLVQ